MGGGPIIPVILAGGEGKRLGPLGEAGLPKQFHAFDTPESLLQQTARRALRLAPPEHIVTVTSASHAALAAGQLSAVHKSLARHIVAEPLARNTGAAVALAALYAQSHWTNATLCILPSDHWIEQELPWQVAMQEAAALAGKGSIVAFGIPARIPSSQFGYLCPEGIASKNLSFRVRRFVEKPSLGEAQKLIAQGALVNSGIFVMRANTCLAELRRHAPGLLASLETAFAGWADHKKAAGLYRDLPSLPIDTLIMEKTDRLVALPLPTDWADLGSWTEIERVFGS